MSDRATEGGDAVPFGDERRRYQAMLMDHYDPGTEIRGGGLLFIREDCERNVWTVWERDEDGEKWVQIDAANLGAVATVGEIERAIERWGSAQEDDAPDRRPGREFV